MGVESSLIACMFANRFRVTALPMVISLSSSVLATRPGEAPPRVDAAAGVRALRALASDLRTDRTSSPRTLRIGDSRAFRNEVVAVDLRLATASPDLSVPGWALDAEASLSNPNRAVIRPLRSGL